MCSKGLDFPSVDLSARIVEWLEVLRALGAEKVSVYILDVHPNIRKVNTILSVLLYVIIICYMKMLEHYRRSGYLEVTPLSLPEYQPNLPWLRHKYLEKHRDDTRMWQYELVSLNDCFYRKQLETRNHLL